MYQDNHCIFCKIVNGSLTSHSLIESENAIAFLDIRPLTKGETLIIPKEHLNTSDLDWGEVDGEILSLARRIGNALQGLYGYKGIIFHAVNGSIQEIPHFHLHVYGYKEKGDKNYFETLDHNQLEQSQKNIHKELVTTLSNVN